MICEERKTLSIIIPIYNLEKYISSCLDSILKQAVSHTEYEIILVDDGSTDNTAEVVQPYLQQNDNLRYLRQDNQGVSAARNHGMALAEGKYIVFVDGDDFIEENSLSTLLQYIKTPENETSEIIVLRSFLCKKDNVREEQYAFPAEWEHKFFTGSELFNQDYIRGSIWGVVFLKKFLQQNALVLPAGIANGEDSFFISLCMLYLKKSTFFRLPFYNVIERSGSASRSWTEERLLKMFQIFPQIESYKNTHSLNEMQIRILEYRRYEAFANLFHEIARWNLYSSYWIVRKSVKKELQTPIPLIHPTKNKKIALLNFSPDLFFLLILLKNKLIEK